MTGLRVRLAAIAGAVGMAMLLSCGDPGPHNNPYDPLFPVTATMSGPDTLFSYLEVAQFNAQFTPAFADTAIAWTVGPVGVITKDLCDSIVGGSGFLQAEAPGAFRSIAPPLEPTTYSIVVAASVGEVDTTVSRDTIPEAPCSSTHLSPVSVTIRTQQYRHSVYKTVILTQRPTRIQLRCPDVHACDSTAVGGTWAVWVDGFDALGNGIRALTNSTTNPHTGPPVATFTSRDTTIASVVPVGIRAATIAALKTGTTWIVATRKTLADSLQLVVK
ncbi:MAG TPA: hypothetical protein VGI97_12800 [Gemmatimonadaceae bacterium]